MPLPRLLTCFILALLAGCAGRPTIIEVPVNDWDRHYDALAAIEDWTFSGRVAVQTAEDASSASLHWQQRGSDLQMTLSGPAGFKTATLAIADSAITVTREGERRLLGHEPGALSREFGWDLPVDYLAWWLRGLPAPDPIPGFRDITAGRLTRLEQAGWTLEFPEYQQVDSQALPRRIRFRGHGVEGKILLKQWILGS